MYVSHDEDDGMWQFLCGKAHETDEAKLVSLKSVFDLDKLLENGLRHGQCSLCLSGIIDFIKLGAGIIIVSVFFIILLVFHLVDMTINRDKYRV